MIIRVMWSVGTLPQQHSLSVFQHLWWCRGIDSYCIVFLHFLFPFSIPSPIWFWSWFVSIYYVPISFLFLGAWCWKWPWSLLPDLLVHFPRYLYVLVPIRYEYCWLAWLHGFCRFYRGLI